MKWTKAELSLLIGLAAAILWCAAGPHVLTQWWTVAFEPLCDGFLSAEGSGGGLVLRSGVAELLRALLR